LLLQSCRRTSATARRAPQPDTRGRVPGFSTTGSIASARRCPTSPDRIR
jgi:hypothetical protein